MSDHDDSLEPSPAQLGDTMTIQPGKWEPLDEIGTQIYVYGDQAVDIAFQTADVDNEVRQLRAEVTQLRERLAACRPAYEPAVPVYEQPASYADRCPDNAPHLWAGRDGRPPVGDDTDRCDACGAQRSTVTRPYSSEGEEPK